MKLLFEVRDAGSEYPEPASETLEPDASIAETDAHQTPFPMECLPSTLREIASDVARVQQAPTEIAALSVLASVSGAAGKAFVVDGAVSGRHTHANLYVIVGAPRGSGKGCSHVLAAPILEASRRLAEHFNESTLPTAEADAAIAEARANVLLSEIKKASANDAKAALLRDELIAAKEALSTARALAAGAPSYWCANATSEALGALLARSGEASFVYSPEAAEILRVLLGKYTKTGQGDCDLWLSGYSNEPVRIDRIGRGTLELRPCLSALLLVQPSVLKELVANSEAIERGLFARMLVCAIDTPLMHDDGEARSYNPAVQDRWRALIDGLLTIRGEPGGEQPAPQVLTCSPAAREVFRAFHNQTIDDRNGKHSDIGDDLSRARENAVRVALNFALAEDPMAVELREGHAENAVILVRWLLEHSVSLLSAGRAQERRDVEDRVLSLLVDRPKGITSRDVLRARIKPNAEACRALLAEMEAARRITGVDHMPERGGHPVRMYTLSRK